MKKIDIKSLIIGILIMTVFMLSCSQVSSNKNFGDIIVKSISVIDNNGNIVGLISSNEYGGEFNLYYPNGINKLTCDTQDSSITYIRIANLEGKGVAVLSSLSNGSGSLFLKDKNGNYDANLIFINDFGPIFTLSNTTNLKTEIICGALTTYNQQKEICTQSGVMGDGMGAFKTYTNNIPTALLSSSENGGLIILKDDHENINWFQTGWNK